jgi:hypothetical protein
MSRPSFWLLVLSVAALVGLLRVSDLSQPYAGLAAWPGPPQFSASSAWTYAETLATRFPRRWSGSEDRRAAADWIATALQAMGMQVERSRFEVALGAARPVELENVWAVSPGTGLPDEIIVAVGNYDMAPTSYQAASDTAGHAGTILELARVMHAAPHRRALLFLFVDGEEWGMLGARHFVRSFPLRDRVVAGLSIEDLDAGRMRALGIDGVGTFRGFSPMWLRSVAADAAQREGLPVEEVGPLFEWLQRSVLVSATDQGPFLEAGIPAIDLAGRGEDRALQDQIYHLPGDTIDKMRLESFEAYGRIQERIVRALDELPAMPVESQTYLRIAHDRVVPPGRLWPLQLAAFLPLLVSMVNSARRGSLSQGLLPESVALLTTFLALLGGLAVLMVLPVLGLMADYELYPPPPRHPLLTDVNWGAIVIVLVSVFVLAWAARRAARGADRIFGRAPAGAAVAALQFLLLALVVVALIDNPFGAVTFLLLPATLWVWITPGSSALRRLGNTLLIAGGFLVIVALIVRYGEQLRLGWYILWYLFMSAAYGQFTLTRLAMTLALAAIGLRLIVRSVVHAR